MSNQTPVSWANALAVPIRGNLHEALNKSRIPNFPVGVNQQQMNRPQTSGQPPAREIRVLTMDLVNNIPYRHWATGWRPGSGPAPLPDCITVPCSDTDVLNTLEKGSLSWWQEILAISAEDLYYENYDDGVRGGSAGLVRQTPYAGRLEHLTPAPPRKQVDRAAMAGISADIMATWASAERRVMIKDLIAEQPGRPEKLDEGLFVYHTDADQVAMRKRFDASYANGLEEGRQLALRHDQWEARKQKEEATRRIFWLAEQLDVEAKQELVHNMQRLRVCEKEMGRQETLAEERLLEEERLKLLQLAAEQKEEVELWNIQIAIRRRNIHWRHLVLLSVKIGEIKSIDCTCHSPNCLKRSLKPQLKQLKSTYERELSRYDRHCKKILRIIEKYQARQNPEACPDKGMRLKIVIDEIEEEDFQHFKGILGDVDAMLKSATPLLTVDLWNMSTDRGANIPLWSVPS